MASTAALRRILTLARPGCVGLAAGFVLAGCITIKDSPSSEQLAEEVVVHAPPPEQWTARETVPGEVGANWIASFADPQLEALVAEAMQYNTDLRVAAARVEQAAAYVRVAGGELYPALDALARGGGQLSGDNSGLEGWLLSASWELDLWGRVRYQRRSAQEQYASSESDFVFARQSIAALVAKSWFMATEAALQRDLLTGMVDAAANILDLAGQRMRVGIGSELEVTAARVTLQTYRDSRRQVQLAYEQSLRALELLVGRYPAATIVVPTQFGTLVSEPPAGLPSQLLERRPDVLAAQHRVGAAFARREEARAARLPRISLTAGLSSITSEMFVLEDRDNPVWSAGGKVLAPLFSGGALKGQVEVRTAEQKQAIAQYVQTALKAFGDVEDALSRELALQDRESILTEAVTDAERALELSTTRYRIGAGDLRSVQQQQIAYLGTRTNLLRVLSEQRVQRVNLHLALGGEFGSSS